MVPSPWNDFILCLLGQFLHVLNKHSPSEESCATVSAKGTHKQKTGHKGFQPLYSRDKGEAWKVNNITCPAYFFTHGWKIKEDNDRQLLHSINDHYSLSVLLLVRSSPTILKNMNSSATALLIYLDFCSS